MCHPLLLLQVVEVHLSLPQLDEVVVGRTFASFITISEILLCQIVQDVDV